MATRLGLLSGCVLIGVFAGLAGARPSDTDAPATRDGYLASVYPAGIPVDPANYASAKARAAAARVEFTRAEGELFALGDRLRRAFETSTDYVAAQNETRLAYDALEAARQEAIGQIAGETDYVTATKARDSLARVLAAGGLSPAERIETARRKLQFAAAATRMEAAAIERSDKVKTAQRRLLAASARVAEIRADFETSVSQNTQWQAAKSHCDGARVQYAAASSYLDGLQEAYNKTLTAFYYRTWWQRYYPASYPLTLTSYGYPGYP